MISALDVAVLDRNSERLGIEVSRLMAAAGMAAAEEAIQMTGKGSRAVIVVGTGNNGGDGMVAARHLREKGRDVQVILARAPERIRTELSKNAYSDLPSDVKVTVLNGTESEEEVRDLIHGADIILDALLGSGAKGSPRGIYSTLVKAMNGTDAHKLAVDSPTGIGTDIHFMADVTVTFHDVKEGMEKGGGSVEECGEIRVRDIGIPEEAAVYVGPGDLLRYPKKGSGSYKGRTGKVLVVGGGPFTGAPILASIAAVKTGADLVRPAVPRGIADTVASASPDLIVERLKTLDPYLLGPEAVLQLQGPLEWAHAVLIGPGAGSDLSASYTMIDAVRRTIDLGVPFVVDADGLGALAELWDWNNELDPANEGNVILTPHRGELVKLLRGAGIDHDESLMRNPYELSGEMGIWEEEALRPVARLCSKAGATVLVKGPVDLIMGPKGGSLSDRIEFDIGGSEFFRRYNVTGVPEMSVGGTGDILSGICTGLISTGMNCFEAASLAAFINGEAGERALYEVGPSLSASSMLERLRFGAGSS